MTMVAMAAGEVVFVFAGIVLFIWRLQYTFPDFAVILLGFLILTFFIHRDRLVDLGVGSQGFVTGMKAVAIPALIIAGILAVPSCVVFSSHALRILVNLIFDRPCTNLTMTLA